MAVDINSLTISEARTLANTLAGLIDRPCASAPSPSTSVEVGKNYLIRTVTMAYAGRCTSITATDIVLDDAAWIADTGRYSSALNTGNLSEVEPYPGSVIVCRGGMIDAAEWNHPLPRTVK